MLSIELVRETIASAQRGAEAGVFIAPAVSGAVEISVNGRTGAPILTVVGDVAELDEEIVVAIQRFADRHARPALQAV